MNGYVVTVEVTEIRRYLILAASLTKVFSLKYKPYIITESPYKCLLKLNTAKRLNTYNMKQKCLKSALCSPSGRKKKSVILLKMALCSPVQNSEIEEINSKSLTSVR